MIKQKNNHAFLGFEDRKDKATTRNENKNKVMMMQ